VLDFDATDDDFVANPFRLLLSSLATRAIAQKIVSPLVAGACPRALIA
jgi:hypothetical protein